MAEEGDDVQEQEEGDAAQASGGTLFGVPRLFVFIGAAVLLLLLVGGSAAYFLGFFGGSPPAEGGTHTEKEHHSSHGDSHGHGNNSHGSAAGEDSFVTIPRMTVNLNTEKGPARFLRLSVVLELEDPGDKAAVEAALPRVVDTFQTYLRELRVEDLRGSAGRYRLEAELLWRVNEAAAPAKIRDVLFQEILVN
ncbi:MAG TPA: flagellar basal body protein FliL [Rhodospirillaceae bacterium]|jgi:flagellar FliL protein|nr:flagellar basal body-associated FliL family protein [Alphaproteobacteria bacterium]HBH26571.1 flagellar basal body protein FliL [Rhodospirillaceae bacterium]